MDLSLLQIFGSLKWGRQMAIKERERLSETEEATPDFVGAIKKSGRVALTAAECNGLLAFLSTEPEPLSIEMKKALENHKRLKNLQVD